MAAPAYIAEIAETKYATASFHPSKTSIFKVSWGLGHLHAADGDPGHLLRQPQL